MDIEEPNRAQAVSWTIAVVTLAVIAVAQVYQIAVATSAAGRIDLPERKYMHRLAWLALAMLSVDLVVLFWLAVRFFSRRSRQGETRGDKTPYVDAWAAAGERFQLSEVNDDEEEADSDDDGDPFDE